MSKLTPQQEAQVANVSAHLFFPLERRLGYFKPDDGADKNDVLLWWAGILGDYPAEDLLWFADYWLRHDEWGKFPRSPNVVDRILKENNKRKVLAIATTVDDMAGEKREFHTWYAENIGKHHANRPFWYRKALEWKLEAEARKFAGTDGQVDLQGLGPKMWKAGIIPGNLTDGLQDDYRRYIAQGVELRDSNNEIKRSLGRLWLSGWESEKRDHAAMVTKTAHG